MSNTTPDERRAVDPLNGESTYNNDAEALSVFDYALNDVDLGLEDLDWDFLLNMSETFDNITTAVENPAPERQSPITLRPRTADHSVAEGFRLQQLDSVESKCLEIRDFLKDSQASISVDTITTYVTRGNLLQCIQLYGNNYHLQMPILHIPTFELPKTPSILLLAMMVVGACYSDKIIPAATIVQFAIHVLLTIEGLPVSLDNDV